MKKHNNGDSFFSEENEVTQNWFKFSKVGDRIKGILTDIRQVPNQLTGNMQTIYEIKTPDGEYWQIGSKASIDAQMRKAKIGQEVGFLFREERKPSKKGYNPLKIIVCYLGEIVEPEKGDEIDPSEIAG